jgi:autotransporter strand-loop-strand O-heptosyltransferase
MLHLDSHCLGDTISWVGYVKDYYYKKEASQLIVTNFWNSLFESPHPSIQLIDHYDQRVEDVYSIESLGYKKGTSHKEENLQKVMTDLMDIPYVEKRPLMKIPKHDKPNYGGKYVCITQSATDISKTWLHTGGWQQVVDYLNEIGYKVVVISKESTELNNIVDRTGSLPITDRVVDLLYADFFIGLPSGLSWLAWACKKKVVMIGGFSLPHTEFQDGQYRVINNDVCTGCWNDAKAHSSNLNNHCPWHYNTPRQHECSIKITPEMVIGKIEEVITSLR